MASIPDFYFFHFLFSGVLEVFLSFWNFPKCHSEHLIVTPVKFLSFIDVRPHYMTFWIFEFLIFGWFAVIFEVLTFLRNVILHILLFGLLFVFWTFYLRCTYMHWNFSFRVFWGYFLVLKFLKIAFLIFFNSDYCLFLVFFIWGLHIYVLNVFYFFISWGFVGYFLFF